MGTVWLVSRIIPADAGSTSWDSLTMFARRDHPRGCGEHVSAALASLEAWGSSPRMRGALLEFRVYSGYLGIIPADAGSTG